MSGLLVLAFLKRVGTGVITWLSHRSFWQLVCIGLVVLICVQHFELKAEQRHSAKVEGQLSKTIAARKADRDAYEAAQTKAAADNQAHVASVEQQYQRNSDNEREAYLRDLARLRADRVRQQGATAAQGSASGAGSSQGRSAVPRADADGVPVPPAGDVREEAAEIELRLMHLQNYVEGLLKVDPNK